MSKASDLDTVLLDLSGSENGSTPFTISDGLTSRTYRPSKGRIRVLRQHVGGALAALPGSEPIEDDGTDPEDTPPGDNGDGS